MKGVFRILSRLIDSIVCGSSPCIKSTTNIAMSQRPLPRDRRLLKDSWPGPPESYQQLYILRDVEILLLPSQASNPSFLKHKYIPPKFLTSWNNISSLINSDIWQNVPKKTPILKPHTHASTYASLRQLCSEHHKNAEQCLSPREVPGVSMMRRPGSLSSNSLPFRNVSVRLWMASIGTYVAPICWVIPPASPSCTFVRLMLSSSFVLPAPTTLSHKPHLNGMTEKNAGTLS